MYPCPCGWVMGCPIAMGRSMSPDASSHSLFVCAHVSQSGCNGDFVIDCGGTGGTFSIVHTDVLCYSVHVCASATYQCGLGEVHGMEMHASQSHLENEATFWLRRMLTQKLPIDAEAAVFRQPVHKHPLCKNRHGEKRGKIMGRTSLSS